jgi:hypothetical protein
MIFPPATANGTTADDSLDYDTEEELEEGQETETTTEILSQLPDAPTDEPVDVDDAKQPLQKKQRTEEAPEEDFVVVDKESTGETKPKSGL